MKSMISRITSHLTSKDQRPSERIRSARSTAFSISSAPISMAVRLWLTMICQKPFTSPRAIMRNAVSCCSLPRTLFLSRFACSVTAASVDPMDTNSAWISAARRSPPVRPPASFSSAAGRAASSSGRASSSARRELSSRAAIALRSPAPTFGPDVRNVAYSSFHDTASPPSADSAMASAPAPCLRPSQVSDRTACAAAVSARRSSSDSFSSSGPRRLFQASAASADRAWIAW